MGAFTRLVHRLAGLPPPADHKPEDEISRAYREAIDRNSKAAEKRLRANLALTDMLEAMGNRGQSKKH